jgi:hypothetical protein
MGYSENATDDQEGYHRGTGFQADGAGNLLTALTVARPVGCEGPGRARAVVRAGYGARRSDIAGPKIRNMIRDQALLSGRDAARTYRRFFDPQGSEGTMATREHDQIVETATEARQAEPGPSVLALLTISTSLAVLILAVVWFVFFRT